LKIPGYITLPPGREAKHLPMVVMPHGGPDDRDSIRFNWLAQFLANRGYVVLQPNYRGSFGYGVAYYNAGLKQWGLRMQDDITDGVHRAIADGIADPKRICIFGAGYGGYAALAGAARTPDLYACAASLDAISDLHLFLESLNAEGDPYGKATSFWSGMIGDRFADDARLKATSPAQNVDLIKCPILLMHNTNSTFSPISQSESMDFALRKAGKSVEFVRLQDDATAPVPTDWRNPMTADTRVHMLELLENFFVANIGR
jgi:dipeptidyl aminopeptidase/acylaminoacyl peptidase